MDELAAFAKRFAESSAAARRAHQSAMRRLAFAITAEDWETIDAIAKSNTGADEVTGGPRERAGQDSTADPA